MHRPFLISLFLIFVALGLHGQTESLLRTGHTGRSRVVRTPQPEITDPALWLRTFAIPLQGTDPELTTTDLATVVAMLTAQKERYVAHSSPSHFDRVLQSARMARQSAEIRFSLPYRWQETRDKMMAENLSWLHEDAAGKPRKLIFWGHNLHVSRVPYILSAESRTNRSVGTILSQRYGDAYYVMATATLRGRWMGITSQSAQTFGTAEIPDLPENSYERLFESAGQPFLFIPFRGMDVPSSITSARPMLIMFASPVYEIFTLPITNMYDSVLFIEESTETTLLR